MASATAAPAGERGVVGHLLHQRGAAQRLGVRDRLLAVGGVEDDLHLAVADGVLDVRAAFQHLVDLLRPRRRFRRGSAAVPPVASTLKPRPASRLTAGRTPALSSSRTETNSVPERGRSTPAPSWLLAKASAKSRSRPMTSPVDFISGPSRMSTPGKRAKGKTASLTAMWPGLRGSGLAP